MTDEQVKILTAKIKALSDVRPLAIDDADSIIRTFHLELNEENGEANDTLAETKEQTKMNGHELPVTNGGTQAVVV